MKHICADAVLYPVEMNRSFRTIAKHCRQIYTTTIKKFIIIYLEQ